MRSGTSSKVIGLLFLAVGMGSWAFAEVEPVEDVEFRMDTFVDGDPMADELEDHFEYVEPPVRKITVRSEFLYLRPRRRALDFAISQPNGSALSVAGNVESLAFEREAGFRVGINRHLSYSRWELLANYFYLHSTDQRTVNLGPAVGARLLATLFHPDSAFADANSAVANASVDLDVLDLQLATSVVVTDSLWLRVAGGARLAWIDQSLQAIYSGGDFVAGPGLARNSFGFNGGGIGISSESFWAVGKGFHLFGRGHGSLMVGDISTRVLQTSSGGTVLVVDVTEEFMKVVPIVEIAAGLVWDHNFGRFAVQLASGYELSNWFGLLDSRTFVDSFVGTEGISSRTSDDLSLDGFFFRLQIQH